MTEELDQVTETIHEQFLEYYDGLSRFAERAPALFMAGELDERVKDDLLRVQLYRSAIDQSVAAVQAALNEVPHDYGRWMQLREEFRSSYADELALTYFTSVMRRVLAQQGIPTEFENDGIEHRQIESDAIVQDYPIEGRARLGKA